MDNFEEFNNILNTSTGRKKIIDFHVSAIIRAKVEVFNEQHPINFNP